MEALKKGKIEGQIEGIGYIRQSIEREDKEDISEQTQLAKIQAYCDYNNIKLVKVFKDIDYSGFRIPYTKRPGIMDALKYTQDHPRVKKFVVFNLSRLTRKKKDFQLIQNTLTSINVDICSASEQLDFGSATGRLVTSILVDFNEYYSDNLSDVMNDNKKTNAIKGRWNGGPAPYGLIKNKLGGFDEADPKALIVKTMFSMALAGKGSYKIAAWLEREKILTETGVPWSQRRVRYVLTNPTYAAMQKWKGKYYPLANSVKLIEWEDFLYLQKTMFGKENVWRGRERQLLSSLLRCSSCGSKMCSRATNGKKTRKYVCTKKNSNGSCSSPNFELSSLNNAVISLIETVARIKYGPEQILPEISDQHDNNISSLRKLQEEIMNLEQAKQKVFDDYYLHQKFSEEQFILLMTRYEKRQKEISILLEKIPMPFSREYGDYEDVLDQFAEAIHVLEDDDKRKAVELIVERIVPGSPTVVEFKWGEVRHIEPIEVNKYNKKLVMF